MHLGTIGELCDTVKIASFTGEGVITLPPLDQLATNGRRRKRRDVTDLTMTFQFATTLPSVVLVYSEGVGY